MIAVVFGFLILILGMSGSIIYLTILSAWLVFGGMEWYGPWVAYIVDS